MSVGTELFREYEAGSEFSLEHHIFPKLVTEGQLNILKLKEEFIDIESLRII